MMGKKWTSKVLAALLALAMLLTGTVFAEDPVVTEPVVQEEPAAPVAEEVPAEEESSEEEPSVEEETAEEEATEEEPSAEEETAEEETTEEEPSAEEEVTEEETTEEEPSVEEETAEEETTEEEPSVEEEAAEEETTEEEPSVEEDAAEEEATEEEPSVEEDAAEEEAAEEEPSVEEDAAEEEITEEETIVEGEAPVMMMAAAPAAEECPHNDSYTDTWLETKEYTNITPYNHTEVGDLWENFRCYDCGDEYEKMIQENVSRVRMHFFMDGECMGCGYENPCEHENLTLVPYTYNVEVTYENITASTHDVVSTTEIPMIGICGDCGDEFEYESEEKVTRATVKHDFYLGDDGNVCECGQVKTSDCDWDYHRSIAVPGGYRDGVITEITETTHTLISEREYKYTCDKCGETGSIWEGGDNVVPVTVEHSFDAKGVCTICSYQKDPCTDEYHESISVPSHILDAKYSNITETTHTVTGDQMYKFTCDKCGESATWSDPETTDVITEEHTFDDNKVCTACGYEDTTCDHKNSWTWEGIEGGSYTNMNRYTHTRVGNLVREFECYDCGTYEVTVLERNVSEVGMHVFFEGRCEWCGYENPCEHENLTLVPDTYNLEVTYENITATTHDVVSTTEIPMIGICGDCGDEFEYESEEKVTRVTEQHDFYLGDDGNECECGQVKTSDCDWDYHLSIAELGGYRYGVITEINEKTHTLISEREHKYTCDKCGETGSIWEGGDNVLPVTVEHSFDAEGVCTICSYSKTACTHANAVQDGDSWFDGNNETFTDITATSHKVHWQEYAYFDCPDCGTLFRKTLDEDYSIVQRHEVDANGECVCGYVVECEHDGDIEEEYSFVIDSWEYVDEKTHREYGYEWIDYICTECEALINSRIGEYSDSIESHEFYQGKCGCGYENPCKHEGTIEIEQMVIDAVYSDINAKGHYVKGDLYELEYCTACHEVIRDEKVKEDYAGTEAHYFFEGECACGWKYVDPATCEHDFEKGSCVLCGYDCYHEYDVDAGDGICMICGETCVHKHKVNSYYDAEEYKYEAIDGAAHWSIGKPVKRIYCDECWMLLEYTELKEVRTRNAHDFWAWDEENEEVVLSQTCAQCGYTKSADCAHAETRTEVRIDNGYEYEAELVKIDEKGHHFEYAKMQDTYCVACGELVKSEQIGVELVIEPHRAYYGDDYCTCTIYYDEETGEDVEICYGQECDHENLKTVKVSYEEALENAFAGDGCMWDGVVYPVNEKNHVLYTTVRYWDVCQDCGLQIYREDLSEAHGSYTAAHVFEDGYCTVCNYKKPAAKPASKPTATPEPTPQPVVDDVLIMVETETTSIEIKNVEKVLTVEEKKVLDTLSVKEQLLTVLTVIGFEDQVKATMAADEETFSEEALALQAEIKERFDVMTEEEKAAFEEMLLASFPTEIIVIDGVEHTMFILELEIVKDGVAEIIRYGFEHVDNEWVFTRLDA